MINRLLTSTQQVPVHITNLATKRELLVRLAEDVAHGNSRSVTTVGIGRLSCPRHRCCGGVMLWFGSMLGTRRTRFLVYLIVDRTRKNCMAT